MKWDNEKGGYALKLAISTSDMFNVFRKCFHHIQYSKNVVRGNWYIVHHENMEHLVEAILNITMKIRLHVALCAKALT